MFLSKTVNCHRGPRIGNICSSKTEVRVLVSSYLFCHQWIHLILILKHLADSNCHLLFLSTPKNPVFKYFLCPGVGGAGTGLVYGYRGDDLNTTEDQEEKISGDEDSKESNSVSMDLFGWFLFLLHIHRSFK